MKIRKTGHCCLEIKVNDLTILTDPGAFSDGQNTLKVLSENGIEFIAMKGGDELVINP